MTVSVVAEGDILGESPVWSVADRVLWWVDVRGPALRRLDPATGRVDRWPLPEIVGAVMLARDGLILALKSGLWRFDPCAASLTPLLPVDEGHAGNRLNDSRVDRRGRIWFSTMWDFGLHRTGSLYILAAGAEPRAVRRDIAIPNGLAFPADGGRVYFADTVDGTVEWAPLDADGWPGAWRTLAGPDVAAGRPDGAAVDAEGYLWTARYGGGVLARLAPDGRLDRLVELPVSQPSSCAFGGAELATLYVTTSRQKLSEDELARQPLAGALLSLVPGVRGLPEPVFAGGREWS